MWFVIIVHEHIVTNLKLLVYSAPGCLNVQVKMTHRGQLAIQITIFLLNPFCSLSPARKGIKMQVK